MWVRSEYAGELAVLATWLTALTPWSTSFISRSLGPNTRFTVINIRFLFFQFHYLFGVSFGEQELSDIVQPITRVTSFRSPLQVVRVDTWQPDCSVAPGAGGAYDQLFHFVPCNQVFEARLWFVGALFFGGLLLLSLVYYADEERVAEALPADPVRVFGGAFAVLAVVFTIATAMFFQHQKTIPVGALFMWVFAVVLLRVERT